MDLLASAVFFVLGVSVGSFLNVVVLRFGFNEPASTRSRCASCNEVLHPRDLVPVLSYVVLKGRCRSCGSKMSSQYPLVELAVGLLFVVTYWAIEPLGSITLVVPFLATLGFWAALIGLVAYDIRHTLIPLPFVYAMLLFAAVRIGADVYAQVSWAPVIDALVGAVVCGGFFALIHVLTRGRGMGIGDAYVAAAIGAMFGLMQGIVACVLGVWIGAIVGLLVLGLTRVFPRMLLESVGMRVTLSSEIPFAPFLAVGAVIAFVSPFTPLLAGLWGIS